jgi:hypothetical protein
MPWRSGGKRGARLARHGMPRLEFSHHLCLMARHGTTFRVWIYGRVYSVDTMQESARPNGLGINLAWDVGRSGSTVSKSKYCTVITNPCNLAETMPYDRHQPGARLIPHSLLVEILQCVTSSCRVCLCFSLFYFSNFFFRGALLPFENLLR